MRGNRLVLGSLFCLLVLGIGSISVNEVFAALDSKGTEFLITLTPNLFGSNQQLHISGEIPTQATINYPANNPTFTSTVNVNPGQVTIVNLPSSVQNWASGISTNNAIKVTSPEEVTVYTTNIRAASSDAALALPTDVFSFKYIIASFYSGIHWSQFTIVANSDNTEVTITPSITLSTGQAANVPFTITLNEGEGVYYRSQGSADVSGTIITSDNPVGVTNGHRCTFVPQTEFACDHIYEHAIPVQGWGTRALVSDLPDRTNGSFYRVFVAEDNTNISLDGVNVATINEGEFHEFQYLKGGHEIKGDKPIFVAQYMTSKNAPGSSTGDPAMANVIPAEQFLNKYTFSTVGGSQFVRDFVTIIAANSDVNTLTFDGNVIGEEKFTPIGTSGFSSTIVDNISSGTHITSSVNGHGILVGGLNSFDSYLYPGGAAFEFINPQPEDDRDGDGVLDINDECPDEFAETANGCPETTPEPTPEPSACEMYAGMARNGNTNPQDGSLALVNLDNGTLSEVGPAANQLEELADRNLGISGIAINSDGRMFVSVVGGPDPISQLAEIDPETGLIIANNLEDVPFVAFRDDGEYSLKIIDLAFHPETDVLYGIARDEVDILVTINPINGDATFVGILMLTDEYYGDAGGLSFLSDGTMLVTGEVFGNDITEDVISVYPTLNTVEDILIPEDWATLQQFYDGLGVSCSDEIYATSEGVDSIYQITLSEEEGLQASEELVAGQGTNSGDVDFLSLAEEPPVEDKKNGGDNQWDTRPTFGISHEDRATQVVDSGFSFNGEFFTLTDNHHTDFAEQSVEIGTTNSFSAKVYADKKLKIQEFLFGIPNVGEAHLAELGVEVWYDLDGNIEDVKVVQKSDVIDAETVSVSHEKTKCLSTDPEPLCDTTTVSMTFLEPLADKVMAIKAIDYALRDQRTFLNEGFDISGESLNPMSSKMIPSNVRDQGLLKVTQLAKYSPYWQSDDGKMFEMNSFGSFKEVNQSFERFADTGDARTRLHSGFGGIIQYEQNRALDVFDASQYNSELPESFAYIYPESGERITEELLQQMLLQEEIAKGILEQMDKQTRFN